MCCLKGRRDIALFVSRKADEPSYDYQEIGKALEQKGLEPRYLTKNITTKNPLSYIGLSLKEVNGLARCRVCFVDRYDPIVALINFESEESDADRERNDSSTPVYTKHPTKPLVIQLWHAFGAYKKFGFQCVGMPEGHSQADMEAFKIHRNYSWIICSGEGARQAFAQAMGYAKERVLPLCRPEYKRLRDSRKSPTTQSVAAATGTPTLLFAPTVRKYDHSVHPFRNLYEHRNDLFEGTHQIWAFHPLETADVPKGSAKRRLAEADFVVTDYSSIVYEAWLLGKRVVFYVPDYGHYHTSPGLNTEPPRICPDLCVIDERDLAHKLKHWTQHPEEYPQDQLDAFCAPAFNGAPDDPAQAIAEFVAERIGYSR